MTAPPSPKAGRLQRSRLRLFAPALLALAALPLCALLAVRLSVPAVAALRTATPERTSYMELRAETAKVVPLRLDQVSPLLGCAVVKAEDRGFFLHGGLLTKSFVEAAAAILRGARAAGGSTLTQQLARNLYLSPERSLWRKLREALIARALEKELGKPRILELYLDSVEWGDGVWGAGPAAERWFHKPAAELDAFEASFLASLLAAPREPLTGQNARRAAAVQRRVLIQLYQSGLVARDELERAAARADALASGVPLAALAAQPGAATPAAAWPAWLASGCGLSRELQAVGRSEP